jgi:hypothetical protein
MAQRKRKQAAVQIEEVVEAAAPAPMDEVPTLHQPVEDVLAEGPAGTANGDLSIEATKQLIQETEQELFKLLDAEKEAKNPEDVKWQSKDSSTSRTVAAAADVALKKKYMDSLNAHRPANRQVTECSWDCCCNKCT